ncbi:MAG: hypothetical protein GX457_18205 [Thermotogaceae bacterium]|nr:hypothetical protein [Thermotogaceae bacterium]
MDISIPFRMLGNDLATEDTIENRVRFLAKRIGFRDHIPTYCGLIEKELAKYGIRATVSYTESVVIVNIKERVILV